MPTEIYTDGAAIGNPGPGGYGLVAQCDDGSVSELSGGFRLTTNNRMELLAVIFALEAIETQEDAFIFTDSQYVANAVNRRWAENWKRRGWIKPRGGAAQNPDLWDRLLSLIERRGGQTRIEWIRGHAGNTGNERADELANAAAKSGPHEIDQCYEDRE